MRNENAEMRIENAEMRIENGECRNSVILDKSMDFAVRVVNLYETKFEVISSLSFLHSALSFLH